MPKGVQVKTLAELKQLSLDKKAVIVPGLHCFKGPIPAAFAINF